MTSIIDHLPPTQGRYSAGAKLAQHTWFRVGGPADILYRPADKDDLACFLSHKPVDIPVQVLGAGSNVLIRDGGIPGVVIRLGRGFSQIQLEDGLIHAGAGCLDRTVALTCRDAGLGGLEFLVGIPGTIGGGICMNAGAYGREMKDILVYAEALCPKGKLHQLTCADLEMTYRHSALPEGWIITGAVLKGYSAEPAHIGKVMEKMLAEKESTQPVTGRTGGSTFKNPGSQKAWELIDKAGCRGLKQGDAQVSEKHCNFFINAGQATAQDLELLGETVQRRVAETSGIALEWEIIRLGKAYNLLYEPPYKSCG